MSWKYDKVKVMGLDIPSEITGRIYTTEEMQSAIDKVKYPLYCGDSDAIGFSEPYYIDPHQITHCVHKIYIEDSNLFIDIEIFETWGGQVLHTLKESNKTDFKLQCLGKFKDDNKTVYDVQILNFFNQNNNESLILSES